jgi:glycosyltransferase involved in cell wall biosynthesis
MQQSAKQLISVVVPIWNEADSLPVLYGQLLGVAKSAAMAQLYRFEFIFVNDGSTDRSADVLREISCKDTSVRVIELSRNFGKEIAVTAGIHGATGEAVIMLDADMQHPVELLPEFLEKWRSGAEVVIGVRSSYGERQHLWKRVTSWMFYKMLARMADGEVVPRATDYRLIDRQVADAFMQLGEHNRITRGLIDWLGFKREYIFFMPPPRQYGEPGYSFRKLFTLALDGFVSLSVLPLRLAGYLGIIITILSGVLGVFIVIEDFVLSDPLSLNFSGPAMLAVFNMFLIGIVLCALGLVALYIANIHSEVINRPLYVVRRSAHTSKTPSSAETATHL